MSEYNAGQRISPTSVWMTRRLYTAKRVARAYEAAFTQVPDSLWGFVPFDKAEPRDRSRQSPFDLAVASSGHATLEVFVV
jgi:hypothetical protein